MATKIIRLNLSQPFTGSIATTTDDSIPLPVNTFWTNTNRNVLSVNVFLILNKAFDISEISPTCDWESKTNTLTINFPLDDLKSGSGPKPNNIWYLEYHVDFGAAFNGEMTIVTTMSEITVDAPQTKRGTTTTVQH